MYYSDVATFTSNETASVHLRTQCNRFSEVFRVVLKDSNEKKTPGNTKYEEHLDGGTPTKSKRYSRKTKKRVIIAITYFRKFALTVYKNRIRKAKIEFLK